MLMASIDGMIMFPGTGVFAGLGPLGVSMFFLTYVIIFFILFRFMLCDPNNTT